MAYIHNKRWAIEEERSALQKRIDKLDADMTHLEGIIKTIKELQKELFIVKEKLN